MPWHIEERDDEFCVIKDADGENEGCHPTKEKAEAQLRALYASENRAPIEARAATVGEVNYPERMIEVLAVPYDQEALVEYRGELWNESFAPGSFNGVEKVPGRIKAFRDHEAGEQLRGTSRRGLIGQVVGLHPDRSEGLGAEVKIAKTPLGDETLSLADEGILGVSVGFGVRGSDQVLNRANRTRRIVRAFLDHLAFPDDGAYAGAQVIGVRSAHREAADLERLETPRLDEVVAWLQARG